MEEGKKPRESQLMLSPSKSTQSLITPSGPPRADYQGKMRIHVQIFGECVAVSCEYLATVEDLSLKAIQKLAKLRPNLFTKDQLAKLPLVGEKTGAFVACWVDERGVRHIREVRKISGGAMLDTDDIISDVLRDEEFILIVMNQDLPDFNGKTHPIVSRNSTTKVVHTPEDSLFHVYEKPEEFVAPSQTLTLDGQSLTTEDLVKCGRGLYKIQLSDEAERRIWESRQLLESIVDKNEVVYGVTTGFGNFANVCIPRAKLIELQQNLVRSHACAVGPPLPPSRARMLLALRINVLAKGFSGISPEVVHAMIQTFNAFCVAWVPEKGTVGCSGDLAPLAHLALGLMGEGRMWSPKTGWDDAERVLKTNGILPVQLGPKEGIALINGTQMVTSLGAEAVERAEQIANQADVIAALTLDVLKGTTKAFDPEIHLLRPHKGQIATAERLRALLHSDINPSQIAESHRFCGRVQDAYTLRCVPQVHGIVHDTVKFVKKTLSIELNSATDNPLVFADRGEIVSAGNFHGEYPAKVLDYLAIATHELAQMSERRLERLVNGNLSDLPPFLTKEGGLNSGFMMVQVVAASLVSENKVLCHPSSVDSIPTSMNQEDHVSMGGFAARKALRVVEHVEQVLGMELLAACQGMDLLKPLTTTPPLQEVYKLVRSVSPVIIRDRFLAPELDKVTRLLQNGQVWACVKPHLDSMRKKEMDNPGLFETPTHSPTSTAKFRFPLADDEEDEVSGHNGHNGVMEPPPGKKLKFGN